MRYIHFHIKDLAEMIRERQRIKKDAAIAIVGFKGMGKTTAGLKILRALGEYKIEHNGIIYDSPKFRMSKDMYYARKDVLNFIMNRRYSKMLVDEMINVGYNREFSAEDQKAIIKALNQYRSPNYNTYVMCNPFFYDLDPDFRNLFWMRIDVIRRGLALVHTVNESLYGNDPWDTNYNRKVEEKFRNKMGSISYKYQRLTTFRGLLTYGALSPTQEKNYERVRNHKRALANGSLVEQDVKVENTKTYDVMLQLALAHKLDKDRFKDMCDVAGVPMSKVRQKLNEKLRDMGKDTLQAWLTKTKDKEVAKQVDRLGYAI